MEALILIAGILLGLLCGGLIGLALRKKSMAQGFGAIIASFLIITAGIFAVRFVDQSLVLPFGVYAVMAFLASTVFSVLKARE